MNPCAEDIKDMLASADLGLTFGENLYIGYEPATPDECVTIVDVAGWPTRCTMDLNEVYRYDGVQIRVRSRRYSVAAALIEQITELLQERAHEAWGDTRYELIKPVSPPAFAGWDSSGRCQFLATFEVQRTDNMED